MALSPLVLTQFKTASRVALLLITLMANALPGFSSENEDVASILEAVEAYRNTQNYRAAINRGLEGLSVVEENGSPREITLLYGDIGSAYVDLGIADSALWALVKAEALALRHDLHKALPIILNEQTEAYFYLPDLKKAEQTARRANRYGKKVEDWEEVSRSLIALGNIHFRLRDLDSALAYYRQDVAIADRHPNSTSTTLMNIGIIWDTRGVADSALYYYLQALHGSQADSSIADEASVLQNLGTFYDDRGNHAEALNYYQRALPIFEQLNDMQRVIITSYNIASVLINQDKLKEGIKSLKEVEDLVTRYDYHDIQPYVYIALTGAYAKRNQFDSMYAELEKLATHLETYPDKFIETEYFLHLSGYYAANDQLDEAIENAMQARSLAQETEQTATLLKSNRLLATYYQGRGNTSKAVQFALEAYDKATISGFDNEAYYTSEIIAELYASQGNHQLAYDYLQKAIGYKDSLAADRARSETNQLLLHRLENEYQELEYQKSLDESELAAKEALLEKQQWRMGLFIALFVLVAILLGTVYYNRTRLKKINNQLRSKNQQIEEQNERLEQLNKDKDRLMHVVAHDLRNPVNGTKGLAQLMEVDSDLSEEQKESVSHILRSSNHALDIINDLVALDLSNPSEINASEVDIDGLIRDIIQSHAPHAKSKSISLHLQDGASLKVHTDKDKVQRIIDNLVSNAIKFTEPGKSVFIRLKDQGKSFQVVVEDQGPGLTDEDRKVVFSKFKKLSAKPTAGEVSTGLGLSIVNDFVKQLNGKIEVDATVGKGSTFTVTLPKHLDGQNH